MNKFLWSILIVATSVCSSSYAMGVKIGAHKVSSDSNIQVVRLHGLTKDAWENFCESKTPNLMIECTQGLTLPLNLLFTGALFAIEEHAPLSLKILSTFYIRHPGSFFQFSMDGVHWVGFAEFFLGNLHSHIDIVDNQPVTYMEFELHQK